MDGAGIRRGGDVLRGDGAADFFLLDREVVYAGGGRDCGRDAVVANRGVFSIVRRVAGGGNGGAQRSWRYSYADVLSPYWVLGDRAAAGMVTVFSARDGGAGIVDWVVGGVGR